MTFDFDEIQKAMEDTERLAFDYFLDRESGDVIILSEEILARARELTSEHVDDDASEFEEVLFDEDISIPDWMEDEIELCLNIFIHEKDRYARIPERGPKDCFAAMKEFVGNTEDHDLKQKLLSALEGKGAFRRFKDALDPYPAERKNWYRHNARAARAEIRKWLNSIGIEDPRHRSAQEKGA